MFITLLGRELSIPYLISQFFALVALLLNLYAVQRRKKAQLLNYSTLASLSGIIHYAILGAWSGVASKAVSTVRDAVAAYEAHKHRTSKTLPLIFVTLYIITGIIAFESPLAILPITASVIYTITIYVADITRIRYVAILSATLWLIYNACVFSIVGVAAEAIFLFNDLIAILRYRKRSKRRKFRGKPSTRSKSLTKHYVKHRTKGQLLTKKTKSAIIK